MVDHDPERADVLRTPEAGGMVIRGGAIRVAGYAVSMGVAAVTAVVLLRYLSVEDFGRYGVVVALLGIVSAVTEAGLTAVGSRELALRPPGPERRHLLGNLVALRIGLTIAGVLVAALFAVAAGYEDVVVAGTLLAGVGVVLVNTKVTVTLPLRVELRLGAVTALEVLNQVVTMLLVILLVAAGASLVAFFGIQIVVGAISLGVALWLVGMAAARPRLDGPTARTLVREALPMAAAVALNVVYLRLLLIFVSLLTTAFVTGLFATSFRIFELLVGLPTVLLAIALPLLSVAGDEDRERFRYGFGRLTEIALLVWLFQAVVTVALAEPAVRLLGGEEYEGAGPILQIQALALVGVFLAQTWTVGLVALRRQRAVAVANAFALVVVVVTGVGLVLAYEAKGAAAAGVVTESLLAVALYVALVRLEPEVAPSLRFAWRPLLAAGLAAAVLLVPGLGGWLAGLAVAAAFVAVAFAVRAVPAEVLPALAHPFRRGAAAGEGR